MSKSNEYRSKAAECAQLVRNTKSLKDGSRFRKLEKSYTALAETEEWLEGKGDNLVFADPQGNNG